MGDGDARHAELRLQVQDDAPDHIGHHGIEPCGRFIEKENLGLQCNGSGEAHAALHAAGEFGGLQLVGSLQAHHVQAFVHAVGDLGLGHGRVALEGEAHILFHRHGIKEGRHLKAHADLLAHFEKFVPVELLDDLAFHGHMARVRRQQAHDIAQEHGLPRAGTAHHAEAFALLDLQVHIRQNYLGPEGLGEIDDIDDGFHRHVAGGLRRAKAW